MIIYTKGRSFSPAPPSIPLNKPTFLNLNAAPIRKPVQPMDFRTARPSTSRKSLDHKGYLQESLEKRNKTFTNLEKTIQDVLDQNKKTKQILKEFLTPYRQKNKHFVQLDEKSNQNCVINNKNLKEISFNNEFHEEDNRETPKGFFCEGNNINESFSNNHQIKQEKKGVFNTPLKENQIFDENHDFNKNKNLEKQKEFDEFMGKLEDLHEDPFSKIDKIRKNQEILRDKFKIFDIDKYKSLHINNINRSNDKIEEKIQFIQNQTKVNLIMFIEEIYDDLKSLKVSR